MSALADARARAGSRPPAYRPLLLATLSAQILTGIALWVVQFPLALLNVAPGSIGATIWLPWGLDGPWAVLAAAGYVAIVCVLGGRLAATRVADRGIARPAGPWAWLAFGASGYAAMALGHTGGARVLLAVVLAPLTLRLFAYRSDGASRPWALRLPGARRGFRPLLLAAALLALSYTATHAFTQNGVGGPQSIGLSPGASTVIEVGVSGIALPARVGAVTLDGPAAGALGVRGVAVASENSAGLPLGSAGGLSGTALPAPVAAHTAIWLAIRVRLRACSATPARIVGITLHYRVLGIATAERVPLWDAVQLACRDAGGALSD